MKNPLITDDNFPVDEDKARTILRNMGLNSEQIDQIIEWYECYGDLKDENWAYSQEDY